MGLRGSTLVIKFIFTLFIARFMGFEVLGLYGLITAAIIFALVFLGMGLTHTLMRKAVTHSPKEITKELWHFGQLMALVYAVVFVVSLIVGVLINEMFLVLCITFLALLEHINNHLYSLLLNRSRILSGNVLHFIRSGAWMIVFMLLSFWYPSLLSMKFLLLGWLIGNVLAVFGFLWFTKDWPWAFKSFDTSLKHWFFEEFSYSKIAYVESIAFTASTYIDRYLITLFLGLELTGVYVFFWSIGSALNNLILTGVIQIYRPRMVQAFKNRSSEYKVIFKSCLRQTAVIALLMGAVVGGGIYFVLPYINRPMIIEWYPILWLIIIGFVLSMVYHVQTLVFYSQHRDDLTLKIRLMLLVGAVGFNLVLISSVGIWGAGIAYVCVAILSVIIQYIYIKRLFSERDLYG